MLLQKLGRLTRLNQLLELLELRWYELQQLLHLSQLLLLENLQLLQLLRHGVQKLQDLRQRLCTADPVSRLARELFADIGRQSLVSREATTDPGSAITLSARDPADHVLAIL